LTRDQVGIRVRALLAKALGQDPSVTAELADDTPLFGAGVALDSLTGLELLTAIHDEFGVDIAAEDYNLDSLHTIGTLVDYLGRLDGS
jgi:acyl carrier protein